MDVALGDNWNLFSGSDIVVNSLVDEFGHRSSANTCIIRGVGSSNNGHRGDGGNAGLRVVARQAVAIFVQT